MATCKKCLHYEACVLNEAYWVKHNADQACSAFKDKSKYVEQKQGRWKYDKNYTGKNKDVWICSNCGHRCSLRKNQEGYTGMTNEEIMKEHKKWCPNCGSKNEV